MGITILKYLYPNVNSSKPIYYFAISNSFYQFKLF